MTLSIKRPKILARAARAGANIYKRERDLSRILPRAASAKGDRGVVAQLAQAEGECDEARRAGEPTYSFEKHLRLLSALVAETSNSAVRA